MWLAVATASAAGAEWGPWSSTPASAPSAAWGRPDLGEGLREASNPFILAGLSAIRAYQAGGAAGFSSCQFAPSCSRFTFRAVATFGLLNGSIVGAERITRCHGFAALDGYPEDAETGRFADPVADSRPPFPWLSPFGL